MSEMYSSRYLTVITLLSPTRRLRCPPSQSSEFHHRDGHLAYGPPSLRCESDSSSDSSENSPPTPIEAHATLQNLLYRGIDSREEQLPNTIVYIDLLRPNSINVDSSMTSWLSPSQMAEERSWVERGYKTVRATQYPRHLCDIDPTITLLSHAMTNARSYFTVHSDDRLIFSESTTLEPVDPMISNVDGILYKTSLVPGLWDTISQSSGRSIGLLAEVYHLNIGLQMPHNIPSFNAWFRTHQVLLHLPPSSLLYTSSSTAHPLQRNRLFLSQTLKPFCKKPTSLWTLYYQWKPTATLI